MDIQHPLSLTPDEVRIIRTLREMPEGPLKARVQKLMEDLLAFARNPRCPELQADGVPCESAHNDCDTCIVVTEMLDLIARRIGVQH